MTEWIEWKQSWRVVACVILCLLRVTFYIGIRNTCLPTYQSNCLFYGLFYFLSLSWSRYYSHCSLCAMKECFSVWGDIFNAYCWSPYLLKVVKSLTRLQEKEIPNKRLHIQTREWIYNKMLSYAFYSPLFLT